MMKFITVSPHPTLKKKVSLEVLLSYNIVINVSDHLDSKLHSILGQNGVQSYWLPLGEAYGLALENIFAAMMILLSAEKDSQRVLLHCVAGRNRSKTIEDCYKYMTTGEYTEDSAMMLNVKDGQLPGIFRLELFLQKCLEVYKAPEVASGALLDWVKKETFGF